MQKYRYIDSLRGIAILAVVFIHSGAHGDMSLFPEFMKELVDAGQYGVQLFFVCSAFTLFLSLKRRNEFHKESAVMFFTRRFFRIAPMYYTGILYYCFDRYLGLRFFIDGTIKNDVPAGALLSNVFFMHGFHPKWINGIVPGGWSIAVEMLFYLFVPLLFKTIKSLNAAVMFLAISLLLSSAFHLLLDNNAYWDREYFIYCAFPNQLPVFALGIIAFFIIEDAQFKLRRSTILLLAVAAVIYAATGIVIHLIFTIAAVLLLVTLSRREYRLFVNPVTSFIGKVSFSMYVIHFAVIFWFDKLNWMDLIDANTPLTECINFLIRYPLVVAISTILSYITYSLIELPFQKAGAHLVARLRNL